MPKTIRNLLLGVLLWAPAGVAMAAEDVSVEDMRSLDEQVQEIKSDVLDIAAELAGLEEKLLFPSGTQVSLFVSLAGGPQFRLDSVEVRIDGEAAAHHIYSYKELEALQSGGVQRLFTGNVPTGDHSLEVSVAGMLPSGREFSRSRRFTFDKDVEPKLLELALAGADTSDGAISLNVW